MRPRRLFIVSAALVLLPAVARAQGPIGPEFRVNTSINYDQIAPGAAFDAAGNFVVVWMSYEDGSSFEVFGQRYASTGEPLGPEFSINTYTPDYQFGPAVAADASGRFVVVWMSRTQDGSDSGVFAQRYASTGTPLGPEFRVNTFTIANQVSPAVALDSSGNFVVVWASDTQDGSGLGVFGQRYASTGAPVGPEFRVNTYTTNFQWFPSVASDSSDNFVVVWASGAQDGSDYGVFGQRYASTGVPLGPEFRVNTFTTSYQLFPIVASDSPGNFVVVWESNTQDGWFRGVFGQRYASSGAPVGLEFRVNSYTPDFQRLPSVGSDSSGNFVVVWASREQDGSGYGVFGQRYASSGDPLGLEFRVNTFTVSNQSAPFVTADPFGNFVVLWTSQDGSDLGVFGQRYRPILPVELLRFGVE